MRATFQPGNTVGKGRPPGAKNKKTIERTLMTRAVESFNSDEYWRNAWSRILKGRGQHLESFWHPRIAGKAPDSIELSGPDKKPLRIVVQVVRD